MSERDRRDPEIGLPRIAPGADEIASRRAPRRADAPRARGDGTSPVQLLTIYLLLAMLTAGVGAAGWYIVQQQELIAQRTEELRTASERIGRMERQLAVTGENLDRSGTEITSQIGFWEDEIRKLWDVANKRNQGWITENRDAIARLDKALKDQIAVVTTLRQTVDRHAQAIGDQQKLLERLARIESRLGELLNRQRDLTDSVNAATLIARGLEKRVAETEAAIESFDDYRLQTNRRLSELGTRPGP